MPSFVPAVAANIDGRRRGKCQPDRVLSWSTVSSRKSLEKESGLDFADCNWQSVYTGQMSVKSWRGMRCPRATQRFKGGRYRNEYHSTRNDHPCRAWHPPTPLRGNTDLLTSTIPPDMPAAPTTECYGAPGIIIQVPTVNAHPPVGLALRPVRNAAADASWLACRGIAGELLRAGLDGGDLLRRMRCSGAVRAA